MNHHNPIHVPDSSIIQALKYKESHESFKYIAKRLGISLNSFAYRVKRLRKAGKISQSAPKRYKSNYPVCYRANSDFRVVKTISKKHVAELLQKGIGTDELAKTIKKRTSNCDCDMYDLRIGGEY